LSIIFTIGLIICVRLTRDKDDILIFDRGEEKILFVVPRAVDGWLPGELDERVNLQVKLSDIKNSYVDITRKPNRQWAILDIDSCELFNEYGIGVRKLSENCQKTNLQ
jgi:hypothetical protein